MLSRLMDGVDAEVVGEIEAALRTAPGVVDVSDVRVRWLGHRLRAEVNLAVPPDMTVADAHAVGQEAEHLLLHKLQYLSAAVVHIDPADHSGETYHRPGEHQHGAEPLHLHG